MSAIDDVVRANTHYEGPGQRPAAPTRKLAVLTCMDARLDPLAAFGLDVGEAHVIRNAGGLVTDDALRSLVISQRALGTAEIAVVHHTRCGMDGFDDDAFRAELAEESGETPPWRTPGFTDVHAQARTSKEKIENSTWLPHRDAVRAFVIDTDSGRLDEV